MSTALGIEVKTTPLPMVAEKDVQRVADAAVDAPTEDLLTQRLAAHEKAAWMLRSLLAEESPSAIA